MELRYRGIEGVRIRFNGDGKGYVVYMVKHKYYSLNRYLVYPHTECFEWNDIRAKVNEVEQIWDTGDRSRFKAFWKDEDYREEVKNSMCLRPKPLVFKGDNNEAEYRDYHIRKTNRMGEKNAYYSVWKDGEELRKPSRCTQIEIKRIIDNLRFYR